jgi:hypothetical protein
MKVTRCKPLAVALLLVALAVAISSFPWGVRLATAQNANPSAAQFRLDFTIQLSAERDRSESVPYVVEGRRLVIDSVYVTGVSGEVLGPMQFAMLSFPGSVLAPIAPPLTAEGSFQLTGAVTGLGIIVPSGTILQAEAGRPPSRTTIELTVTVFGRVE